MRSRARSGHTLAELLVVLTILSLVALIAIPRFITAVLSSRLDAALNAARSDLDLARARAVATGVRHQLLIDGNAGEILVQPFHPEEAAGSSATAGQTTDIVLRDTLPQDVRVSEWTVTPLGSAGTAPISARDQATVLTCYPEGSADSARLVLEDTQGARRGLEFDGYSGLVREIPPDELGRR